MPLSDTTIRNAKPTTKPFKLTDSNGLYIEIKPNGNKFWRYRYRIDGKENLFAIGKFCSKKSDPLHVSLADARTLRDKARILVKQGIHPVHHKRTGLAEQIDSNRNTFKAVSLTWFEETKIKKGWTEYYSRQVLKTFEADVYPVIGTLPIDFISPDHIETVLSRIERRKAFTVAILARQWCSAAFRYAIRKRKATNDPTAAFKGEIMRPTVKHSKVLPVEEIPVFLNKLVAYGGDRKTAIALNLLMLTLARTKELRESVWKEFDFEAAIWRIPAARMKKRREHLVPLSTQVITLLVELRSLTGQREWLFPNSKRPHECMSATTLNRAIEYMGYKGRFSCHGFRSTASTQLNEFGYRSEVIETALSHSETNAVRKAYNQAEYLSERKQMLQDWANYLDGLKAKKKIIPIRRKA